MDGWFIDQKSGYLQSGLGPEENDEFDFVLLRFELKTQSPGKMDGSRMREVFERRTRLELWGSPHLKISLEMISSTLNILAPSAR